MSIRCFSTIILAMFLSLFLIACDDGGDSNDFADRDTANGDIDGDESTDGDDAEDSDGDRETVSEEEQDDEANDSPVRARQLEQGDEMIGGPNSQGRAGDYILFNEKVRFIIQDTGPSRSWVPYGGSLIDADIARDGEGHDLLGELTPITAFIRAFEPEEIEIVADGSDGEKAHLRVTGVDAGIPIIDSVVPLPGHNLEVTMDYELEREANYLKVTTTIIAPDRRYTSNMGDGVVWGNRTRILTPGFGWGLDGLAAHGEFDLQLAISKDGQDKGIGPAYGLFSDHGTMTVLTDLADILPYMGLEKDINDGSPIVYTRYFAVGKDLSEVIQAYAKKREIPLGWLSISVNSSDSADANELFDLEVLDEEGTVAQYLRTPSGLTRIAVVPGNYSIRIGGEGRPWSEEVTDLLVSEDAETETAIDVVPTGRVEFAIGGDHFDGSLREGLPSKITIQPEHDADVRSYVLRRVYTASGVGVFMIEPGNYTITATRGYEYELCRENLTVVAGETVDFQCTLQRVVDTTGWVAGDLHIHTERSIDAIVRVEDRVVQCAAEGVERTPITDHDTISDLDPLVEPLGLRDYIRITAGDEVSPATAHTNGFPMIDSDEYNTYFGVQWHEGYDENGVMIGVHDAPEIWAQMREKYQAGIIQINHPREGQGLFDLIDYDPLVGISGLEEGVFDENWDTVELINSGAVEKSLEQVIPDWFSLLNQGIHRAGTAVSDTHTYSNPGQARSYIRTGFDDPNEISDELFVNSIKAMRVQAASGPFVTFKIGEALIGDTTTAGDGGTVRLDIKVQAPSWMPLSWVRIVRNGEIIEEITELADAVIRLEDSYDFLIDKDSWFVVMAGAPETTLAPEGPGQPVLTIANPIFVDLEGDGYNPPGLPDPIDARRAFNALKNQGKIYDPIHHEHGPTGHSHRFDRCGSIAGLGDHHFSQNGIAADRIGLRKLLENHSQGMKYMNRGILENSTNVHRYGYGSNSALPKVRQSCAQPDLIPTTILQ